MKVLAAGSLVLLLSIPSLTAAVVDVPLVEAVKNRDVGAVRSLLEQKVDVNLPQTDGATALQWAAYRDDLEMAELLIRAGARADAADDYGATPLTVACTNGSDAMVGVLLKAGADPNTTLPTGETALMTCARTSSAKAVELLLARGANVNAKEARGGQTALMWAAAQKRFAVAQVLTDHGADVHVRSKGGFTALLFAARGGDVACARVLLAGGANVNEELPGRDKSRGGPLLIASASGHEALSIFLLENGADPNVWDGGAAPLHYAVMAGVAYLHFRPSMTELVKELLAHGADPNVRFVRGSVEGLSGSGVGATPFVQAAAAGDSRLMRILLEAGADPALTTRSNVTPVMAAAGLVRAEAFKEEEERAALEALELAVELGGDVNAADNNGRTALHGATRLAANEIIQFLADRGASVDARDKYQQTPLSIASGIHLPWVPKGQEFAEEGFVKKTTMDLLLKLGARPLNTPGYFTSMDEDSEAYRFNPRQARPVVD